MKTPKPIPPACCPKCGEPLDKELILAQSRRYLSQIGGQAKGKSKVRDHATLSAAAKRRWERHRKENGRPHKV